MDGGRRERVHVDADGTHGLGSAAIDAQVLILDKVRAGSKLSVSCVREGFASASASWGLASALRALAAAFFRDCRLQHEQDNEQHERECEHDEYENQMRPPGSNKAEVR